MGEKISTADAFGRSLSAEVIVDVDVTETPELEMAPCQPLDGRAS